MRARTTHTLKKTITVVGLMAALVTVQVPSASAQVAECRVNWDDPPALARILDEARLTFVTATGRNPSGGNFRVCRAIGNSVLDNPDCWQYRQTCGANHISVWDQYYGHYHLAFEDPRLNTNTCFINGGFGRMSEGRCVAPDWTHEPRIAVSHTHDAWWEILLLDPGNAVKTFDFKTITVGGTTPIQMWFKRTDGSVAGFKQLGNGVTWDVSASAFDLVAVWVSGTVGRPDPFEIDAFTIKPH